MNNEDQEVQKALQEQKQEAKEEQHKIEAEKMAFAQEVAQLLFQHIPNEVLINVVAEILGAFSIEDAQEATTKAGIIKAMRPFKLLMKSATYEQDGETYIDTRVLRENINNEPAFAELKRVMDAVREASDKFAAELAKEDQATKKRQTHVKRSKPLKERKTRRR